MTCGTPSACHDGVSCGEKGGFQPCFVAKTYSYCFITLPAVMIARDIWMPDMDVKRLDTSFAVDLDEWEAPPTRVRSPISAAVQKANSSLNVNVSCMWSQLRLSRRFVLG